MTSAARDNSYEILGAYLGLTPKFSYKPKAMRDPVRPKPHWTLDPVKRVAVNETSGKNMNSQALPRPADSIFVSAEAPSAQGDPLKSSSVERLPEPVSPFARCTDSPRPLVSDCTMSMNPLPALESINIASSPPPEMTLHSPPLGSVEEAIATSEKAVLDEMNNTAEALRRVIKPKAKRSPTAVLGGARKGNLPEWKNPTLELVVRQWMRRRIFTEGVDLKRFREGDMNYVNELVDKEAKNMPGHYTKMKEGRKALKKMVKRLILEMFVSEKPLPYQIDHWYVDKVWKGMGLFATRKVSTKTIAKAFADIEPNNCEVVWLEQVHEGYDSVYTGNWSETLEESRSGKGWHQKELLLSEEQDVPEGQLAFTALFAVYGRLMFANHHDDGPFYFKGFKPTTPRNAKGRIGGKLTIAPHDKSYIYNLGPGQQILVHYDFNLAFAEDGSFCEKPVEKAGVDARGSGGGDEAAASLRRLDKGIERLKMLYKLSAEEEVAAVLAEKVEEKERFSDEEDWVPGKPKKKVKTAKKGKKHAEKKRMKEQTTAKSSGLEGVKRIKLVFGY